MRDIIHHIVAGDSVNHQLELRAVDARGSGGANHEYSIIGPQDMDPVDISFQNGPIKEAGVNGLTHEVLLAILIDRLEGFQSGPFASHQNEAALQNCRSALFLLQQRTRDRMARGVEGTSVA